MTTRYPVEIEKLSDDAVGDALTEELGTAPCPTPGCKREGKLVRVATRRLTLPCSPCSDEYTSQVEAEERAAAVAKLMEQAGATRRLSEFTLATYPNDAAGKAARLAAEAWRDKVISATLVPDSEVEPVALRVIDKKARCPNLFLYGPVGGGKTGLMWPLVREFNEQLLRSRFVDFPSLLEQMKDAMQSKVPFDRFSDIGRVPVLVLDDVGAERPTEWARGQLLQLVNIRYERCLPTAYVSNYEPNDLMDRLGHDDPVIGERIVSRMIEGAIRHRVKASNRRVSKAG